MAQSLQVIDLQNGYRVVLGYVVQEHLAPWRARNVLSYL